MTRRFVHMHGHPNVLYTVILEIFIYEIFQFSSELIFVGGATWHYKLKFSGKLIFIEGTTYDN